ncbi:MAG: DMT family transporter [Nitrospinaceae bacterium]
MISITSFLWGILPIFLKMGLKEFSAGTIVWFRFFFAFVLLYFLLALNGSKPSAILRRPPWIGIAGGAALSANYFWVTQAIDFSGPSNVAILIQIAPILLVVVGIIAFRERLRPWQWGGMLLAGAGMGLFYRERYGNAADVDLYNTANLLIVLAAVAWVAYMVCQKILSHRFEAQSLNLLVYATASIIFLPMAEWADFSGVSVTGWVIIVFLAFNTLLAYGALAEAVERIPLSLISIIITVNPLVTLAGMKVLPQISSGWLEPESVGFLGYLGAVIAVAGVVLVVSNQPAPGREKS